MLTKHKFPDDIEVLFIEINFIIEGASGYFMDHITLLLNTLLYQHELKSLNKEATCYKNPNKPSCIDLILTYSPHSFFNTKTYFTGLSDCHKLVLSVFKTTFSKTGPKEMMYRNHKNFDQGIFS